MTRDPVERGWPGAGTSRQLRQWPAVEEIGRRVAAHPAFAGLILLGSFAAGLADQLSDVDLMLVAEDGAFGAAWAERGHVHDATLAVWDIGPDLTTEVGAHKWLTADMVLVECLIASPRGGVRLAPPHVVLVGDPGLATRLPRRPPISRSEMGPAPHPIEGAYDAFKEAVRAATRDRSR